MLFVMKTPGRAQTLFRDVLRSVRGNRGKRSLVLQIVVFGNLRKETVAIGGTVERDGIPADAVERDGAAESAVIPGQLIAGDRAVIPVDAVEIERDTSGGKLRNGVIAPVIAAAVAEDVVTTAAVHDVVADAAGQDVILGSAVKLVVSGIAEQNVVSRVPPEHVIAVAAASPYAERAAREAG